MENRCYRASINSLPEDQAQVRDSAVPLFFSVEFEKEGAAVPVVADSLVRCGNCKAYLNPYVEILMPGLRWSCNICRSVNEVQEPFQMLERLRNDHADSAVRNAAFNRQCFVREDLRHDVYEMEAPDSFSVKTSEPPVLCFVVDVSLEAQKLSVLGSVLGCIRETLRGVEHDKRTKVCFMFFNEFVYLLNANGTISVIPSSPPLMLQDAALFQLSELVSGESALDTAALERYFETKKSVHSNLLAPLHIAKNMFRSASVFLFFSSAPSFGKSAVSLSDSLACGSSEYKAAAEALARKNICANVFVMARASIGFPTVGVLAQLTGGAAYHYSNYDGASPVFTSKLYCDLADHFARSIGFGAACRIRATEGAVLKNVYGNFVQKSADLLGMANWNPSHCINFSVMLFNNVSQALYLQIAMIRITKTGQRMIRVFNICLPVQGSTFYDSCDAGAICHALVLDAFYYEGKKKLAGGERMQKELASIWRELASRNGQIPANLADLPSLVLAARKSIPLRPDAATPVDFRAYYVYLFSNAYAKIVDLLVYPLLLNINDNCLSPLPLSMDSLVPDGLFLLDTGATVFFYAGKSCSADSVAMLFDGCCSGPILFAPPENELSKYVLDLVAYVLTDRPLKPRFVFVNDAENTVYNNVFYSYMYNDKMYMLPSLDEYSKELATGLK
ncbi:protein transport protein SEC24 [Pancytospora philotis]|nr:protein transport protein SEC24 [Pancytospora philotis]